MISYCVSVHYCYIDGYRNLVVRFHEMLQEAGTFTGSPLVLFLDGFDNMEPVHLPHNLDWLPETMPKVNSLSFFPLTIINLIELNTRTMILPFK